MIPTEISLSIDGDMCRGVFIRTTLPVKPNFDDLINFSGLNTAELSDDFFRGMAALINGCPEAISIIGEINDSGPVESYKDDIIEFLDLAEWHIQNINIRPNGLYIHVDFMEEDE